MNSESVKQFAMCELPPGHLVAATVVVAVSNSSSALSSY
jgi:hypothetical protein